MLCVGGSALALLTRELPQARRGRSGNALLQPAYGLLLPDQGLKAISAYAAATTSAAGAGHSACTCGGAAS